MNSKSIPFAHFLRQNFLLFESMRQTGCLCAALLCQHLSGKYSAYACHHADAHIQQRKSHMSALHQPFCFQRKRRKRSEPAAKSRLKKATTLASHVGCLSASAAIMPMTKHPTILMKHVLNGNKLPSFTGNSPIPYLHIAPTKPPAPTAIHCVIIDLPLSILFPENRKEYTARTQCILCSAYVPKYEKCM